MEIFIFLIIIILSIALYFQVKRNPATMRIGTYGIFIAFNVAILMHFLLKISNESLKAEIKVGYISAVIFGVILMLNMVRHSWKKSYHIGLALLVFAYLGSILFLMQWSVWWRSAPWLMIYFVWQFGRFAISSLIYGYRIKAPHHGPLVVLGGGLVDGYKVGNIVNERIKAAVKDAEAMPVYPIIVFSGGRGDDQLISEAQAMRDWAVSTYGVPFNKTLLEDNSRNTYQNLQYTSQLLNQQPFTFYTSEYHVFRGVLLAQVQHIEAEGRGGYVALNYRIPAFFREFAGVMSLNTRRHVVWSLIWLMFAMLINIISVF